MNIHTRVLPEVQVGDLSLFAQNYDVSSASQSFEDVSIPLEPQPPPPTDVLLMQGGIAVAINLSLVFVLWALAILVTACKKPAQ